MLLYRIIISTYFGVLRLASFFSAKARLWVQGRKAIMPYATANIQGQDVVWVHCSSLGEFEQGRPIIEGLRQKKPDLKVLLTFFSPSGYEVRKNYEGADYICYLPEDKPKAIDAFLTQVKPKMVIFVKYDYWFLLLKSLIVRGIPIYFVSAVVKKGHFLTKWYAGSFRKILKDVKHFYVQDDFSQQQFLDMGIEQVTVAGDTRVDRVAALAQNVKSYPLLANWTKDKRVFICGSTWEPDEAILVPAFQPMIDDGWNIIIAPHDVSEKNVQRLRKMLPENHLLFSNLDVDSQGLSKGGVEVNLIVVDTIGQLNALYQYGTICYIGGGFNKAGLHNTLEPATFGLALIYGPNYMKFAEAKYFVEQGGAYQIGGWQGGKATMSTAECQSQFAEIWLKYQDEETIKKARQITKHYVKKNQGATAKILNKLCLDL